MSQSRKPTPKSPKALRPWAILAVAAVILLIGFVYFPLYNQPGLHTAAGFFPETETGVYSAGGASGRDGLLPGGTGAAHGNAPRGRRVLRRLPGG